MKTIEGRLIGYLPFEGVCEIEFDDGSVRCYGFSARLVKMTRDLPDTIHPFLYRFVICELLDYDVEVIDHFEIHPLRE